MAVDSYKWVPGMLAAYYKSLALEKAEPIPWTPLAKPIEECRFSLVTSAGIYLKDKQPSFDLEKERQNPFWGDPTCRTIPREVKQEDIGVAHLHINTTDIEADMNIALPIQPGLSLGEAHKQVSAFERRLKTHVANVREVLTHIEPVAAHSAPVTHTQPALDLRDQAIRIANQLYPHADWHQPTIRLALGGYAMTMHCHLPASISVEEAHGIAEHVETCIRNELTQVQRVTIHTEPPVHEK